MNNYIYIIFIKNLFYIIPISNKDFTEEIAEREIFIRFINIVLNLLNSKERLVMLYRIADINQAFIANNLNLASNLVKKELLLTNLPNIKLFIKRNLL